METKIYKQMKSKEKMVKGEFQKIVKQNFITAMGMQTEYYLIDNSGEFIRVLKKEEVENNV